MCLLSFAGMFMVYTHPLPWPIAAVPKQRT
jgi:hypothetical protein